MLSPNPARRAVERYWLGYTAAWGGAAAAVMLSGLAERWGDGPLIALGAAFALGAVAPPLWRARRLQPELPWHARAATKLAASVVIVAFGMNYVCTPYFFDVLHMRYGFHAALAIEHNPVFLYLMTVAYFATYFVLVCGAYRWVRARARRFAPLAGAAACLAVAALETLLNANPFTRRVFCYDDVPLMLWFGTLSYGACFAFALPAWLAIDETAPRPFGRVVVDTAAAIAAIAVAFALSRRFVAPLVTTVHPGAGALGAGGCLIP